MTHATDTAVQAGLLCQYQYDAINRPDIVTAYNVAGINRQLNHDYDRFGNRRKLTVSNWNGNAWVEDFVQEYTFNKLDQLDNARLITSGLINFDYYNNDETRQIAFPSGVTNDFAYYNNGPLHWVQIANGGGVLERLEYTYDKLLNVQDMTDADGVHAYDYDGVSRLTSATHPQALQSLGMNVNESYGYDDAGNREDPVNAALYDYDANNRIQLSPGINGYTFDDSGNMTARADGASLTYDHDNRLATFSKAGINATYTYDSFGRRIKKTINSATTSYLWDGSDLIAEYDSVGSRIKRYAYSPYDYSPLQYEDANGTYDVHLDHMGAPRLLTDQNGGVVWRVTYESFGKAFVNDDVDGDGTVVTFDVRYPGQWEDSESGLYYNLHRYYQPNLGGYYSRDPKEIIGLVASLGESFVSGDANLYRYVINSPLNFIDPEGAERKGGSKKGNNGVIGQPFNRPGPVDQSGRTGRTGNPISQPPGGAKVKNPNVPTAEKVKRRVMSKVIEKITSKVAKIDPKTGLITPNPVGVGIVLMSPASTAECQTLSCDLDGDGFADKEFNEGICKPGFN